MNSTARPRPKASTTPIAESRSLARCPRKPKSIAAKALPTSPPSPTLRPVSKANAAPVSESSLDPCTANDICRMTMNGPIRPATSDSRAAARRACCTKSRRSRSAVMSNANRLCSRCVSLSFMGVPVGVTGMVEMLTDNDVPATYLHNLDIGPVQLRESL